MDALSDLGIPRITAAQLILIEPYINAHIAQGVAHALRCWRILRAV
jgi:hypothetical protein